MSSVIDFPRKGKFKKHKEERSMITGNFNYTCPTCKTENKFRGEGIIFKKIEFYCSHCGEQFTVSNPDLKNKK